MARLTILQASQQGFGSTLTIHRHIKDGSLPIYEEGDVKLLEVDDLISLFGEPGQPVNDNQTGGEASDVDIYEYNRMKSELDQKNKKNMWLAADLAEAVRDLREKEANFHAERERLLKILEQAQALLLREAKRAGAGLRKKEAADPTMGQASVSPEPVAPPPDQMPSSFGQDTPAFDQLAAQVENEPLFLPDEPAPSAEAQPSQPRESDDVAIPGAEPSPDVLTQAGDNAPSIVMDAEERGRRRGNGANPLMPPLEDQEDKPTKTRLMGTFAWLSLFFVVACGLVFLKFRPQIMTSIEEIIQVFGGV